METAAFKREKFVYIKIEFLFHQIIPLFDYSIRLYYCNMSLLTILIR